MFIFWKKKQLRCWRSGFLKKCSIKDFPHYKVSEWVTMIKSSLKFFFLFLFSFLFYKSSCLWSHSKNIFWEWFVAFNELSTICDVLRDLVPFVQSKKREKHPWRNVTFRLKPVTLLKVTLLHGCVSCFLNCKNGAKSRDASHLLNLWYNIYCVTCPIFPRLPCF